MQDMMTRINDVGFIRFPLGVRYFDLEKNSA